MNNDTLNNSHKQFLDGNNDGRINDNISISATTDTLYKSIKSECSQITHRELVKLSREAINNIVESDPLLSGLPFDVTLEEIRAQIAVAQGQAITLLLNRCDLPKISVVVPPHDTTVLQLKKAIKRHVNLSLKRENVRKKIGWKHIWKKYDLCFQRTKLQNDSENVKAYGIGNKAELYYVKKRREKNKLFRT